MPHILKEAVNGRIMVRDGATNEPLWTPARSPSELGLAGDGITDDTATLQGLLNTEDDVYLPQGTYLVTASGTDLGALNVARDNSRIYGDLLGRTTILVKPTGTRTRGLNVDGRTNVRFQNLVVQSTDHAILDGELNDIVRVNDCTGVLFDSVKVTGPGDTQTATKQTRCVSVTGSKEVYFDDCVFEKSSQTTGVYVTTSSIVIFENCIARLCGTHGVQFFANTDRITVDSSRFDDNGQVFFKNAAGSGDGLRITGRNCLVTRSSANGNAGVSFRTWVDNVGATPSHDTTFLGCDGSAPGAGTYPCFGLLDDSGNNAPMISRTSLIDCNARLGPGVGFSVGTGLHTQVGNCAASSCAQGGFEFGANAGVTAIGNSGAGLSATGNSTDVAGATYGLSLKGKDFLLRNLMSLGHDPIGKAYADESTWVGIQPAIQINEESGVMVESLLDGMMSMYYSDIDTLVFNGDQGDNIFDLLGAGTGSGYQGSRYGPIVNPGGPPAFFSEALVWISADDINADGGLTQPAEGTFIGAIENQGAMSLTITQGSGTRQPPLLKDDRGKWFLKERNHDGTDRRGFRCEPQVDSGTGGPFSLITVTKPRTTLALAFWTSNVGNSNQTNCTHWKEQRVNTRDVSNVLQYARYGADSSDIIACHSISIPSNWLPNSGAETMQVNGVTYPTSSTSGANVRVVDDTGVGGVFGKQFESPSSDLYEQLFFNRELTAQELADAYEYLRIKWLADEPAALTDALMRWDATDPLGDGSAPQSGLITIAKNKGTLGAAMDLTPILGTHVTLTQDADGRWGWTTTSGSGDNLIGGSYTWGTQARTIMYAFKQANPVSFSARMARLGSTAGGADFDIFATSNFQIDLNGSITDGYVRASGVNNVVDKTFVNTFQMPANPTPSTDALGWVNGISQTWDAITVDGTHDSRAQTQYLLGRNGQSEFEGLLCEFLTWNRELTDQERTDVLSYLVAKHKIDLST